MRADSLRQDVLGVLQRQGPAEAIEIWRELCVVRPISRTAVHTVLTRLVADGLLVRHGRRRHYVYTCEPSVEVARSTAQQAARDLMMTTTGCGLVHFVEALDQGSPELARQLERLLAERRAQDGRS